MVRPAAPPQPVLSVVEAAFFTRQDDQLVPSPDARSPWSDQMLHGRLLAALAARAVEDSELGEGMIPVRLTIDLFRAAPMSPVTISTQVVRDGHRVKVAEVGIFCEGKEVARASALMIRSGPPVAGRIWGPDAWDVPDPEALPEPPEPADGRRFPMDIRMTGPGGFGTYSRKRAWVREVRELVEGESPSPFVRAAGAADLANPLSNSGDAGLGFINGDLSVYLARLPEGEWLGLDVTTHISDGAVAVGACDLYDHRGRIGTATVASVANPRLGF